MNIETGIQQPSIDLFAEDEVFQHEYASTVQRFLNWLQPEQEQ